LIIFFFNSNNQSLAATVGSTTARPHLHRVHAQLRRVRPPGRHHRAAAAAADAAAAQSGPRLLRQRHGAAVPGGAAAVFLLGGITLRLVSINDNVPFVCTISLLCH